MTTGLLCRHGEFPHEDKCCKGCPKGQSVKSPCKGSESTVCQPCPHGYFMDDTNFLTECRPCRACHSNSRMVLAEECKADQNRRCKCEEGYYCQSPGCDHCRPVSKCPSGSGVSIPSNGRTDTICEPCPEGKYNNVTDSKTPCLTHTKCEDLGMQMQRAGTKHSDAVCTLGCHWVLPAGLWAGLILTLLLIGLACFYRRMNRRSKKKGYNVEQPMNDVALNLPNLVPAVYNQPCNGESHALCYNRQHADSDVPSTVTTLPCQVDVHCAMKSGDLECDGPGMPTLMSLEHLNQSAARTSTMKHFSPAPWQSQPQEDEWSGT